MIKELTKRLREYSTEVIAVNKLLVSLYIHLNKVTVEKNELLNELIVYKNETEEWSKIEELIINYISLNIEFNFEQLILAFEFVVSPFDKEVNGAIYTPLDIREKITSDSFKQFRKGDKELDEIRIGDISCGCGGFLLSAAKYLKKNTASDYKTIFKENIFGLDIQRYSVDRTKILLSLLAIEDGEDLKKYDFNLYTGDALEFNWTKENRLINRNKGFDLIIGNPPYVCSKNIDNKTKLLLDNWKVSKSGHPDLYIVFIEIGIELLSQNGILGYITVNSFLKTLNGRNIREYIISKKGAVKIIDFGSEQIFRNRSTYTCLFYFQKKESSHLKYILTQRKELAQLKNYNLSSHLYSHLAKTKKWILAPKSVLENLNKIKNTGTPLGNLFVIRNGFATLRNNIYLIDGKSNGKSKYYEFEKNGKKIKIEKAVCKKAIKPNILKNDDSLAKHTRLLIFPYSIEQKKINLFSIETVVSIIPEKKFKREFPFAYNYLLSNKNELSKRDKGQKKYETWYAYGRRQSLSLTGMKLLFPHISDKPFFTFSNDPDLLFHDGFAILGSDEDELKILKKLLESEIFWYYIKHTSKPYSGGYFSLAKNYIKDFGIYTFSEKDKKYILKNYDNSKKLNSFFMKKYELTIL